MGVQGNSSHEFIDLRSESRAEAALRAGVSAPDWISTTHEVLVLLSRKWVVPIVQQLVDGPRRSFQLCAAIGIQPKVLRETLRFLERDRIVERVLYDDETGAGVGYQLTDVGWTLLEPLSAVFAWGSSHLAALQTTAADTESTAAG
jgi:DNA-binding HxlR family transcriptional regulator